MHVFGGITPVSWGYKVPPEEAELQVVVNNSYSFDVGAMN